MPKDGEIERPPRHSGEGPVTRSRKLQWAAAAGAVVVAGLAAYLAFNAGDGSTPDVTATAPQPQASAFPSPSLASADIAPGEIVIEAGPDGIDIYAEAGDTEPLEQLDQWTPLGSPTTLMGFSRKTVDGHDWIQVELLGAPNHREGWVQAADATVTSRDARIDIYLDEREVELTVAGEVSVVAEAVIGEDASPTPLGVFWVTDVLDFSANPTGVYGAYALGLNGWSETLEEFNGGPPQIAVHGTNEPDFMGQAVSNGCIRLPNDIIMEIAESADVGVGTPVVVHASRPA